jgi:hypothetical protein
MAIPAGLPSEVEIIIGGYERIDMRLIKIGREALLGHIAICVPKMLSFSMH